MIHCENTPEGFRVQIVGPARDVLKESLHVIRAVYESCADNSIREAELYKKLVLSAVLGFDGFCIFDTPSDSVRVDLSALHEIDRNGGDI